VLIIATVARLACSVHQTCFQLVAVVIEVVLHPCSFLRIYQMTTPSTVIEEGLSLVHETKCICCWLLLLLLLLWHLLLRLLCWWLLSHESKSILLSLGFLGLSLRCIVNLHSTEEIVLLLLLHHVWLLLLGLLLVHEAECVLLLLGGSLWLCWLGWTRK